MYLDSSVVTAGALRLLQLLLNPFITAGLQSASFPGNGLPYSIMAVAPQRQFSGSADLLSTLASLQGSSVIMPSGMMASSPAMAVNNNAMMAPAVMPPLPYAPWLFAQALPAVQSTSTGPVYVPASAVSSLLPATQGQEVAGSEQASSSSATAGALAILEQAIAPYTNNNKLPSVPSSPVYSSSGTAVTDETASPMPMQTLLSVLGSLASGIRVVVVNFMSSFAVMGVVQLARLVVQNLPVILNVLGLSRVSMARVIADGVTKAQCLERAACVMGRHAGNYQATPDVIRWLRSPDRSAPEHPVWRAFRTAAEGNAMQCDVFAC